MNYDQQLLVLTNTSGGGATMSNLSFPSSTISLPIFPFPSLYLSLFSSLFPLSFPSLSPRRELLLDRSPGEVSQRPRLPPSAAGRRAAAGGRPRGAGPAAGRLRVPWRWGVGRGAGGAGGAWWGHRGWTLGHGSGPWMDGGSGPWIIVFDI